MKSKSATNKDRQATFKKRMRAAGFVQVTVWIPVKDSDRHSKYVERLTKRYCNE